MTERDVQNSLYMSLARSSDLILPNFRPADWFEADVWSVDGALATEHEIKLSRADLERDQAKVRDAWFRNPLTGGWRRTRGEDKHSRLSRGDVAGPSYFYFVLAPGLTCELTSFAGLKVAYGDGRIRVVRPAPRLHSVAVGEEELARARKYLFARFWKQRMQVDAPC